jgi:hypothetical protein
LTAIRMGYRGRRGGVPLRVPHGAEVVVTVPDVVLRARGGRTRPTVAGMVSRRPSVMT